MPGRHKGKMALFHGNMALPALRQQVLQELHIPG